jgi:hypothetical protein
MQAVILSSSEGSAFEFPSTGRFFLRYAQDRLLAPQNDSSQGFSRNLFSRAIAAPKKAALRSDEDSTFSLGRAALKKRNEIGGGVVSTRKSADGNQKKWPVRAGWRCFISCERP